MSQKPLNISLKNLNVILGIVLILTIIFFFPSLNNGFTNWDDQVHLLNNTLVKSFSLEAVFTLFKPSSLVNNTYIPLSLLSYALEYKLIQLKPFLYHLNNLLLHLGVVVLVFRLAMKMGLAPVACGIGALIFAIHPLHVEPVAWISSRKDLLYSLFYLLALLCYVDYVKTQTRAKYLCALAWGVLSILAKPMAFSLPLILIIYDWFFERKISWKAMWDKVPFFIYVFLISLITYSQFTKDVQMGWVESILIWIWAFGFYIVKWFIPMNISPLYTVPDPLSFSNMTCLLYVLFFVLMVWSVYHLRRNRLFIFAFVYYVASITLLIYRIPWNDGNLSIVADRYMYLPSLGLCIFIGHLIYFWLEKLRKRSDSNFAGVCFSMIALLGILGFTSMKLTNVWANSVSMWSRVIAVNPKMARAYADRGAMFLKGGNFDRAMKDLDQCLTLDPKYFKCINHKGLIYLRLKEEDKALLMFNQALQVYPDYAEAYLNRGNIYFHRKQYTEALKEYESALQTNPTYADAFNNKGNVFYMLGQHNKAREAYKKALELKPAFSKAAHNLGQLN